MSHNNEYHDAMIAALELVWGEGFMAPGGKGNVDRMVDGLDVDGKKVLDIGCGIGGPAIVLARDYGAHVTGTDLEPPLVVEAGPIPFDHGSFDIVFSSGAFTQIDGKEGMFSECLRVLKAPGCYGRAMRTWFKLEGLTYAMRTLDEYRDVLAGVGLVDVAVKDVSPWYRHEVRRENEKLKDPFYDKMVSLIGKGAADHFVENWRAMMVVCEPGEMRQGYSRGCKPG